MSTADNLRAHGLGKLGADLPALLEAAKAAGLAWLEVDLDDAHIVAVWPSAEPITGPTPTAGRPGAREALPWDHYAPELREDLKQLATRYKPDAVADAAVRLAELIALHGPPRPRGAANAGAPA